MIKEEQRGGLHEQNGKERQMKTNDQQAMAAQTNKTSTEVVQQKCRQYLYGTYSDDISRYQ